jgi:hypothetical protein
MNIAGFRRMALSMPEAIESSHMGHPDFRVKGKIFATLFTPRDDQQQRTWGMVKLTPQQQREFIDANPEIFEPVAGGWGARGATKVNLKSADKASLRTAMLAAWRNTAPKTLVKKFEQSETHTRR